MRCTSARLFRWDINHEEMLNGSGKLTVRTEPLPETEIFVNDWENSMKKPSEHFDDYFSYENDKNIFYTFLSYLNPMNLYITYFIISLVIIITI